MKFGEPDSGNSTSLELPLCKQVVTAQGYTSSEGIVLLADFSSMIVPAQILQGLSLWGVPISWAMSPLTDKDLDHRLDKNSHDTVSVAEELTVHAHAMQPIRHEVNHSRQPPNSQITTKDRVGSIPRNLFQKPFHRATFPSKMLLNQRC